MLSARISMRLLNLPANGYHCVSERAHSRHGSNPTKLMRQKHGQLRMRSKKAAVVSSYLASFGVTGAIWLLLGVRSTEFR